MQKSALSVADLGLPERIMRSKLPAGAAPGAGNVLEDGNVLGMRWECAGSWECAGNELGMCWMDAAAKSKAQRGCQEGLSRGGAVPSPWAGLASPHCSQESPRLEQPQLPSIPQLQLRLDVGQGCS